jgi:hypothetical protein
MGCGDGEHGAVLHHDLRAVLSLRDMLEVDYIRRMDLEESFVGANTFKRLYRSAALVGRAIFTINIIIVFIILKI